MRDYADLWAAVSSTALPLLARYRSLGDSLAVSTKSDGTLLSEADVHVEQAILRVLRDFDPGAGVIAEESASTTAPPFTDRTWVVDPIDGTGEFVRPGAREFCAVVAVLWDGQPEACMILAPEISLDGAPIIITVDGPGEPIRANGECCPVRHRHAPTASATRPSGSSPPPVELRAIERGFTVKTAGTSQTLDMVRTCVNLEGITGLASFRWFLCRNQKLWDGAAGLTLARATSLSATDAGGQDLTPFSAELLARSEPILPSTLVSDRADLQWILPALAEEPEL